MDIINITCAEIQTPAGFLYVILSVLLNHINNPDCEQSWLSEDERLIADPSDPQKLIAPVISVSSDRLVTSHCVNLNHEIICDSADGLHFSHVTAFRARNQTAATPNSDLQNEVTPDLQRSDQLWWLLAVFIIVLLIVFLICLMKRKTNFRCFQKFICQRNDDGSENRHLLYRLHENVITKEKLFAEPKVEESLNKSEPLNSWRDFHGIFVIVFRLKMAMGLETLPEMSAISSSPDDPGVRIILIGRNGSGKSSSGNTILRERKFKVQKRKKKNESEVCEGQTQIGGKRVAVIDCPDLLDPDLNEEKLEELKEQLVSRCSAGFSSVLLTVPLEKPVQNEEEILNYIKCLFGPKVQKYTMILFTYGDELEELDQTIHEHLQDKDQEDIQQLVTECGGKFHCFNNKRESDDQIQELLQKIEEVMEENGGKFIMEQRRRSTSKDIPDVNFSGESPAEDLGEIDVIPERKDQIRLVLLGKTGVGKSASGNAIIGRNVFKSSMSSNSETKQCQSETVVRMGKEISVTDTPGLYDNKLSEDKIITEIGKCITLSSPGPHAFVIVIKLGRFTEEEKNTIKELKEVFGEQIEKYSMIIFTHKDQLEKKNMSIEQFLQDSDPDLKELVQSCGNRFFCLDNESAGYPQIKDLISKIEKMVEENGGHFTNDMFEEAEKYIQEIQKQKLDEKVKEYKEKNKQVSQSEWQKMYLRLVEDSRREALRGAITHLYIASADQYVMVEIPEETESEIKEAESKRISRRKAVRLAFRATGTLAKQKMCRVQ